MAAMKCITTEFHGVQVHFIYFREFLLQCTIGMTYLIYSRISAADFFIHMVY